MITVSNAKRTAVLAAVTQTPHQAFQNSAKTILVHPNSGYVYMRYRNDIVNATSRMFVISTHITGKSIYQSIDR